MIPIYRGVLVFMAFFVHGVLSIENEARECDLYLAPSTIPGAGRGVIAGKSFGNGSIVEAAMSIAFKSDIVTDCQLNNYVFLLVPGYNIVTFGGGVLYNHKPKSVQSYVIVKPDDDIVHPSEVYYPFTSLNSFKYIATGLIHPGQEMYVNYGEGWFEARGMTEDDAFGQADKQNTEDIIVPIEDLDRYGHCLTDVHVAESLIPFAGKGLFAKRPYNQGEIVVIAPVLALPKDVVQHTRNTSVLANFVLTAPDSEITLLPVTNAALMNHQPSGTSNVDIHWYDWSSIPKEGSYYERIQGNTLSLEEKLAMTPEQLFAAPFSQLDIAFRAVRDIDEGEELTYDYGVGWAIEWNEYVEEVKAWEAKQLAGGAEVPVDEKGEPIQGQGMNMSSIPLFRSYISVPEDFFPVHWLHQ